MTNSPATPEVKMIANTPYDAESPSGVDLRTSGNASQMPPLRGEVPLGTGEPTKIQSPKVHPVL